jgi:uncharacterized protein involved in exopolysaccharide biosynthesis
MELQVRETEQQIRTAAESIFRQQSLFLSLLALVFAAVVVVTFASRPQYPSRMKILLENNRANAVITSDRGQAPAPAEITDEQINSELEILGSEDVLTTVADPNWTKVPQSERTPLVTKQHEDAVLKFRKHLAIDPVKKSNIIDVSYTANSPKEAEATLERFSSAYLAERRRLSRPAGTADFYAYEAKMYEDAWHRANADLVAFQQGHDLVSVQDSQQALGKEIADYEDRVHENEANLAAMEERLSHAKEAETAVSERQQTQIHTILNQASTEQMRTLLVQLQNRRTELLTRYNATDPLVVEINREIAETTASLSEARIQKGTEDTTDINPAWQQLENTVVQSQVEQRALLGRQQSLQHSIAGLRDHLSQLQSLDVTFNTLQEEADQARSNFELFSQKRDQAQIEDAMDERQLINIAVVQMPTLPFRPITPKTLQNLALGCFTALFLALGAVYFAESTRATFATARELERSSSYPVLATAYLLPSSARGGDSDASVETASFGTRDPYAGRLGFAGAHKAAGNPEATT